MSESEDSNRRDFLTGRAVKRLLRQRGAEIADALAEGDEPTPPTGGDTVRLETRAMGCQWSVILNPGPPRQVMVASDALDLVHACEDELTVYRENSDAMRLNRLAAESPKPTPLHLFKLLEFCQHVWEETDGAFDPAAGALIQLWRAARQAGRIPTEAETAAALACTGLQHVHLRSEDQTVSFDRAGVLLDFGAVGKGYAVDLAATHLKPEGIEDFLVHGGYSSLYAQGQHEGRAGWPVGLKNPLFPERRYATVLLSDAGLSTSGSNIQYFRHEGRRYGHILDPRSGQPADGLLSATVIAPTAAEADALSTAFYVMGLDKAVRYCDDHPEAGAILIPTPTRGRTLDFVIRNIPEERIFFAPQQAGP